jgi:hypothetical protein
MHTGKVLGDAFHLDQKVTQSSGPPQARADRRPPSRGAILVGSRVQQAGQRPVY